MSIFSRKKADIPKPKSLHIDLLFDKDGIPKGAISSFVSDLITDGIIRDFEDVRIDTTLWVLVSVTLREVVINDGDDVADTIKRVLVKIPFNVYSISVTYNK